MYERLGALARSDLRIPIFKDSDINYCAVSLACPVYYSSEGRAWHLLARHYLGKGSMYKLLASQDGDELRTCRDDCGVENDVAILSRKLTDLEMSIVGHRIRRRLGAFREELMMAACHPSRLCQL